LKQSVGFERLEGRTVLNGTVTISVPSQIPTPIGGLSE